MSSLAQLRNIAKNNGIKGYSTMCKDELLKVLRSGVGTSINTGITTKRTLGSTTYKFRAEAMDDILNWLATRPSFLSITIEPDQEYPDVEVTMTSQESISKLRQSMQSVPDSHVMRETLNYANKYNGDRWFDDEDEEEESEQEHKSGSGMKRW